jgi:adenosylmethionine-8-amino-7-oxononanoate aminotransferase
MIGIEFVKDDKTLEPFPEGVNFGVQVGTLCMHKYRLLVRYAPQWVALAPPLTTTTEEIDILVERLAGAIREVHGRVKDGTAPEARMDFEGSI